VVALHDLCAELEFLPVILMLVSSEPNSEMIVNLKSTARSAATNLIHVRLY
jgi:hypothetical protein